MPFATLTSEFAISIDSLYSNKGFIKKLQTTGSVEEGAYFINQLKSESLLQSGTGELFFEPFSENPQFRIDYILDDFDFERLFERLHKDPTIFGTMNARIQLSGEGVTREEIIQSLIGEVLLDGKDLVLRGIDLDNLIRKMGRTQNFNLVDVAGMVVAGPIGLAFTKGSNAVSLLINNPGDSTIIGKIVSDYNIANGELELDDVAFSTLNNRVAFKGHYNLMTDSIGIVVAVVDSTGAATWHQAIAGTAKDPKLSKVRPVAALLKPIDNLFKDLLEIKGKQFYDGRVEHPLQLPAKSGM